MGEGPGEYQRVLFWVWAGEFREGFEKVLVPLRLLLTKHYSWCVKGHVSEPKHGALGSKSFAISGASTAKLNLLPRSATKVRAEMGYDISGPSPW